MKVLAWIWGALCATGRWLRDNPLALAAAAGALVGAYFMWKSRQNKIASLEDAVAVQATKRKIAKAEAQAELLQAQAEQKEPEIKQLQKEIADSKRRVVEIHENAPLQTKSDAEIAEMFSKSGL